ncbi:MAG TPA: permease, partial [Rhodopila sp.]|nr:permease [Rhodopila sp.]
MADFIPHAGQALLMAAGMFWQVGWSLVLGFGISAVLQAVVSKETMGAAFGRAGIREIALATAAGAASSSCSYASAAVSRTLFKKGAALIPSLAFIFASTNLVAELGIVLYLLMGWQFMAGEWIGGIVLVIILSLLVRLTYPAR